MSNAVTFESKLLPEGHLYCPRELAHETNARFKVIVVFDDSEASDSSVELSAIKDNISNDFLSPEELNYYLNLEC